MPSTSSRKKDLSRRDRTILEGSIRALERVEIELQRRHSICEPTWYKMPDLLCPQGYNFGEWDKVAGRVKRVRMAQPESDQAYKKRQNAALFEFVTTKLYITKDGRNIPIIVVPKMLEFVADIFFKRTTKAILWKGRGTGGSLCAAVLIWLCMVYHKMSFVDMAGALEQAKIVYDYVTQFWGCIPNLKRNLVVGDPLISSTKLITGTHFRAITTTEKQARGKHVPGLVLDESSIIPGTMIMTKGGVRPIEEIESGDIVLSRGGEWNKVLRRISHPYSGKILKLKGRGDGIGAWITEEHRVFGITGVGVIRKGKDRVFASKDTQVAPPDWVRAWDFDVGDILAYPRSRQRGGDSPEFLRSGDEQLWRFLGYWCGDGCAPVTKTGNYPVKLNLGKAKDFFVPDAMLCMEHVTGKLPKRYEFPSRSGSIDLVVSSCKEWWEILRNQIGLSDDRGIPVEWLETASDEDLRQFLIGLFRTDGGATVRPDGVLCGWTWVGTSSSLAMNVMYCTSRLGIPAYVATREPNRYGGPCKRVWSVKISWGDAVDLLNKEDIEGKKLPGKLFRGKQWCDESRWYSVIQSIEEDHFEGEVYDLQVENDPSFGCLQRMMLHNCQRDSGSDDSFKAAMNITMSEPEHMIIMLSTFHVPVGMFQQYWDFAEERGFTRYKWTVFDAMSKCDAGVEFITEDDPTARAFCRTSCPLTEQVDVKGEDGQVIGKAYKGCDGKARDGKGFLDRENVINAKIMNTGSEVFPVEFCCERPRFSGPIYGLEAIERAVVEEVEDPNPEEGRLCVGIDWGTVEGALVLLKDCGDFIGVIASRLISARIASDFAEILYEWQDTYGHFEVFADASHPFENNELDDMGFDITAVDFGVLKDDGIANLLRLFVHDKIKIIEAGNDRLIQQLKHFHRDGKTGKIVKKDDHGPDALMCATITFDFRELWPELISVRGGQENKGRRRNLDEKGVDKDTSILLF
jgi:hypothetical protein